MLQRIKQLFGYGHTKAIISCAAKSAEMQEWLLDSSNVRYLRAFVKQQKYVFAETTAPRFFAEGDKEALLLYLGYVSDVNEECIMALLKRQDKELSKKLLSESLWVPFPYGTTVSFQPSHIHTELQVVEA